ncbi:hypothetical protein H0H81_002567 [Sphagnurus paluster]|uniref:Uncharacterized protein n=1 Tax=Sphagnurus paluster TaxID=117069 RepID=A0A9P7GT97_9AGAR|nr:hypothetical protein H0H81_002567 [Sphagnurus paluster]
MNPSHRQQQQQQPSPPATPLQVAPQAQPSTMHAEPLSAYARWKLEEDELFYATFPEARYAAQHYDTIAPAYLDGTGYYYDVDGQVACVADVGSPSLALHYEYEYPAWLTKTISHDAPPHTNNNNNNNQAVTPTAAPTVHRSAQEPAVKPEPFMDYLPSPTASTSHHDPEPNFGYAAPLPVHYDETTIKPEPFSQSSQQPHTLYPPLHQHDLDHHRPHPHHHHQQSYYPTIRSNWPLHHDQNQTHTRAPSPPPRGIRLSPLPPSRRPLCKKPPLACLFCRGRKIACGPADPGSTVQSCK